MSNRGYEHIVDHYESPYHRGKLSGATLTHTERNAACGDWVRIELKIDKGGRVESAYFDGGGCIVSQAAASMLCEYAEGRGLEELADLTAADMHKIVGIELLPRRQQCALLAFRALKVIIYSRPRAVSDSGSLRGN